MLATTTRIDPSGVEELIDTSLVTGWDVLWAVVTLIAGSVLARLARIATKRTLARVTQLPENLVDLITKFVGWGVITLAVILALPFVGVDTGPVVVIILLLAAFAALSGRALLENFGAGVILQSEAPFEPGDQIATNEHVGRVVEVSSRAVQIETIDGRRVVVPNSSVLSGPIVNLTSRASRRSELEVGLEYGTDLDAARQVLLDATQASAGVFADPAPEIFVTRFGDSSIDFLVWFWHASDLQSGYDVTDSVARSIDRACKKHGLTIAFPQRTLWWGGDPPAAQP